MALAELLKDVAENPAVAASLKAGTDEVLDRYGLSVEHRSTLKSGDPVAIANLVKNEAATNPEDVTIVLVIL